MILWQERNIRSICRLPRMCCNTLPKTVRKFRYVRRETEPKIKFYIEVSGELKSRADYDNAVAAAEEKIKAVSASLGV